MADRWNMPKPEVGPTYPEGFVTPFTVREFSDFATLQTVPENSIPGTMLEQMDGDANIGWAGGARTRSRKRK